MAIKSKLKKENVRTLKQNVANSKLVYEQNLKLATKKIEAVELQLLDLKKKQYQLQGAFAALSKLI